MQHQSSNQLFNYWNSVRNGRLAPNRLEIEPSQISGILPEVFILECADAATYRFRLAGTRICTTLGHELRGFNLLDFWSSDEREAVRNLLHNVARDGAGAVIEVRGSNAQKEHVTFELLVLPLVHSSESVNRMLGSFSTFTQPYWLGTIEIRELDLVSYRLIWPDVHPRLPADTPEPAMLANSATPTPINTKPRLRVVEGGLSGRAS